MNSSNKKRPNATRSTRRRQAEHRRRELAQHESPSQPTTVTRRRPLWQSAAAVLAIVAVFGGVIATALAVGGDDGPNLSLSGKTIADQAPEQAISPPPSTYRLAYTVVPQQGDPLAEDVTVDQPFSLRYRVLNSDRSTVEFDLVQTASRQGSSSNGVPEALAEATPQLLGLATRYDQTLADLVAENLYVRRERREVFDQQCTVYRTGATFEGGEVIAPSETRYADLCISDEGFILEEVAVRDGVVELRVTIESIESLTSAEVDISMTDDEDLLATSGVVVFDLDPNTRPTNAYFTPPATPTGFTHLSRQRVEVTRSDDSTGPVATRPAWSDVYQRGNDLMIVNQGPSGNELVQINTAFAPVTSLGELDEASLVVGFGGVKVVAPNVNGRFVQVTGTVSKSELTAFAASLTVE